MKILHTVQSYYPAVSGMSEVVRQLSERLTKKGHAVTVATEYDAQRKNTCQNGVQIEQFAITGNSVIGLGGKQEEIQRYQDFLLNSKFDIMVTFAAQQWATDLALPLLDKITAKKIFVPTGFSGLYIPDYKDYFEKMKSWMKQFDMNVFLSNDYRDINFARENGVDKTILIPNGAAEDEFLPPSKLNIRQFLGIHPTSFLILHVGAHTGLKGHSELIEIFEKAPIANATLLLIGLYFDRKNKSQMVFGKIKDFAYFQIKKILVSLHLRPNTPPVCPTLCRHIERRFNKQPNRTRDHKHIFVRDLTREQTVASYQQADLFLFPSNVECSPIVLFECMAAKLPFLTSDVGNCKEIIEWSHGGILLPTGLNSMKFGKVKIDESVTLLKDLVDNIQKRTETGATGFKSWQERFTWEKITSKYEKLYIDLINSQIYE